MKKKRRKRSLLIIAQRMSSPIQGTGVQRNAMIWTRLTFFAMAHVRNAATQRSTHVQKERRQLATKLKAQSVLYRVLASVLVKNQVLAANAAPCKKGDSRGVYWHLFEHNPCNRLADLCVHH